MKDDHVSSRRREATGTAGRVRTIIAVAALLVLGALLVAAMGSVFTPGGESRRPLWLLLVPLILSIAGLVTDRFWARWLGLAIAIAVLPWAFVITFVPEPGLPVPAGAGALAAAVALLAALAGRRMAARYEGKVKSIDWFGPRMRWLGWTVIGNLASVLTLLLFVVAYRFRFAWHMALLGAVMAGLIAGVVLLARQLTAGLLLVWLCCIAIIPVGAMFVLSEATGAGEALLFAAALLPGALTGWATVFVFGRPLIRFLRS
jgi:hypothetical protein